MAAVSVIGKCRHFKGGEYEVLGEALHSETKEEMIVYRSRDSGKLWVRPKKMFLESVEIDGKQVPRFQFMGD